MDDAQAMRGKVVQLYREDIDDEVIFAAELIGMDVYAGGNSNYTELDRYEVLFSLQFS